MLATQTIDNLSLTVNEEIHVNASLESTFDSLIANLGRLNETPDGKPFPMTLEPWPGGRWFRDLGGQNGHFWGHVQAIKRPTLLEIAGPLFMSYPVMSNIQYRLKEVDGVTTITLKHSALGLFPENYRTPLTQGWTLIMNRVRQRAEGAR